MRTTAVRAERRERLREGRPGLLVRIALAEEGAVLDRQRPADENPVPGRDGARGAEPLREGAGEGGHPVSATAASASSSVNASA